MITCHADQTKRRYWLHIHTMVGQQRPGGANQTSSTLSAPSRTHACPADPRSSQALTATFLLQQTDDTCSRVSMTPARTRVTEDVRCSAHHASGEGPAPLSNGLSLVLVRPSTINPQGVRYASVRPLRLRLRGDRGRPRTRRRLSSGDGPRRKTGAFQCRTISPSLRITPSISPAR